MSETKGTPPGGEHIEELLSQLKGIFGHLSETEKEEAKQKITPPPKPSSPPPTISEPIPSASTSEDPPPLVSATSGESAEMPLEPWVPGEAPEAPPGPEGFAPAEVTVPPGASLVPAMIFYPGLRSQEAKMVAEKVERITPKFTKVAVVINVQSLASYDPKTDLKSTVVALIANTPTRAVFVLVDKPLEEARRKSLVSELEPRGIYFQEIPFHQLEKKAFYTDMLLGMVFFFDSQKPPEAAA